MNKSLVTNLLSGAVVVVGYGLDSPLVLSIGLFALSGAITNWLAIHMLFEKVPGLYGSGVVPSRFEEFKKGMSGLVMEQFFTQENIDRFLKQEMASKQAINFEPIIDQVELSPAFAALVKTIEQSSFGGMLSMFGGTEALQPLKEPFIEKMKHQLLEITSSDSFHESLKKQLASPDVQADMRANIATIVRQRLDEMTPLMVKDIVQQMIKSHLGWLVIWGGVFGGLIGLLAGLLR